MVWESDNERRDGTVRGAREAGGDIENEEGLKGSGDTGEPGSSEGEDAIASEGWEMRSKECLVRLARISVDRTVGTRLD